MAVTNIAQTLEIEDVTDIVVTSIVAAEVGFVRELRIFVAGAEEGDPDVQALTVRLKSTTQAPIEINAPAALF